VLTGMLLVVLSWAVVLALLTGVGCLVARPFRRAPASAETALAWLWLGWAAAVAGLQVWHLQWPVGGSAVATVALVGAAGLWSGRAALAALLRNARTRTAAHPGAVALAIGLALLFVLWLANRAMGPITPQGDSGFYHIGAVRWMQAEPLLPGLANVDGRFGFNNALFLYLALVDWPPGPPHFFHVGLPVLYLAFLGECALHLRRLWRARGEAAARHVLWSLWPAAVVPCLFMELGSTSTDTANLLVGFALGGHLFRLVFERPGERDGGYHAFVVVVLATVGVTVKLSFAFLGFFACCAAGVCLLRDALLERPLMQDQAGGGGTRVLERIRPVVAPAVAVSLAAGLLLGVWVARGVVMTGYVAYPSNTALHLDVDWKVPEEQVAGESDAIKVWARYPFDTDRSWDEILSGWDWLGPWLARTAERADLFTIPMLLFATGAIALLVRRRPRPGPRPREAADALLFLGPPAIAFVLWFVTAPAERFGGAIFWLLGAGIWAVIFAQTRTTIGRRRLAQAALATAAVTVLAGVVAGSWLSSDRYGWAVFVTPGPEAGFHPIPEAIVEAHRSDSGLVHYVPTGVAGSSSEWVPQTRCWDAPLPCTIRPKPELVTRRPDTWRAGFRLDTSR